MFCRYLTCLLLALMVFFAAQTALAQHRLITQGNGKLAIVEADGTISWEMPWGGIHDIHLLDNGNLMVQQGQQKVVEIDRQTKQVVWSYDSQTRNVSGNSPVEVHAFQPLPNGNVMIAESGRGRIIEVDREGKLVKQFPLKLNSPHPHMDTRLARQLEDGSYLVCHEGDGYLRHYAESGEPIWEFEIPLFDQVRRDGHGPEAFGNKLFGAVRLENGNYLVATGNGHSVLEVTPEKQIVWQLRQNDLPGITLAWVTTLEVLKNGHYVIGNCHAGPGQPLLIEINPANKEVVWKLDQYETFGNNVSNSQLLDVEHSRR
jgi:outer membrane protein assembly factor BamB